MSDGDPFHTCMPSDWNSTVMVASICEITSAQCIHGTKATSCFLSQYVIQFPSNNTINVTVCILHCSGSVLMIACNAYKER